MKIRLVVLFSGLVLAAACGASEQKGDPKKADPKATDVKAPDVKAPDGKTPDGKTPEAKTPEVKTPEVKTPEVATPTAGGGADCPSIIAKAETLNKDAWAGKKPEDIEKLKTTLQKGCEGWLEDTRKCYAAAATSDDAKKCIAAEMDARKKGAK